MKERPILFSGPMVRAILERRKSQTRRVVNPQPPAGCGRISVGHFHPTIVDRDGELQPGPEVFGAFDEDTWSIRCPYGEPGDRLWVRETWAVDGWYDDVSVREIGEMHRNDTLTTQLWYAADGDLGEPGEGNAGRWRPSIYCFRWASRITLEVASVAFERLQEITEEDAIAEGIPTDGTGAALNWNRRHDFRDLWDSINGKRPGCAWEDNPTVWVIGFEMCCVSTATRPASERLLSTISEH